MHVCFCSPDWPAAGAANGIVSYTAALRGHLISLGHTVSVIAHGRLHHHDGRSDALPGIEPVGAIGRFGHRVRSKLPFRRGALGHVGHAISAQVLAANRIASIDVLEMEESFGWSGIVQRNPGLRKAGIAVVTRLHGPFFLNPAGHRTRRQIQDDAQRCHAEGQAIRSARALTAPTRAIMDAACETYQRPGTLRRAVIPNPVAMQPEQNRWRSAECDHDHVLAVGRFDHRKGADTMIAAFALLLQSRPNARLTMVGPDIGLETPSGQTLRFNDYLRTNVPPHARERITFLGTLPPLAIAELRQRASVTVIASRFEVFCYTLLEAYAAGCPVVSTAWSGAAEIVQDGTTGLLTPVADPHRMARTLEAVLADSAAAARLGDNGRRHCRDNFSVDRVGGRLLDFYAAAIRDEAA